MQDIWARVRFYLMRLAYFQKRSKLKRYGFPLVLIIIFIPLVYFIPQDFLRYIDSQTISLIFFIIVVTVSSWYGGLGPGLFATVLLAILSYFTLLNIDYPRHSKNADLLIVFLYFAVGILISIISEARYEAELQKDEFIGLTAHELKNPLAVIIGFASLLHQSGQKLKDKKVLQYTKEIESQSEKLLSLINELLDVNKIEVGKFTYKKELFEFDNLVKEIISHQQIITKDRIIYLSGSSKKTIEADRYRIGQVITNLLTNASKYSPEKSKIEVKIKTNHHGVILNVKDYGIGISKSEQKKVFSEYYRTRNILRTRTDGLGLGLYICKAIIQSHKGKIWVKSSKGHGSTFFFYLPVKAS